MQNMSTKLSDKPPDLTSNDSRQTEHDGCSVDPALVQIHASRSQVCQILSDVEYMMLK